MAARIDLEIQAPGHYTSEVLIYPSPFEPRRVCRVWITSAGFKEIFWILNAFSSRLRSAGKGGGVPGQIRSEHQAHFVSESRDSNPVFKPRHAICAAHAAVELRPAFG
jgi:hypothetical protein